MTVRIGVLSADVVRDLAVKERVCVRPIVRRVIDRETGTESIVPIPCGSRRESVCPSCAQKARLVRMQQCAEGWHRTTEPDQAPRTGDTAGITDDAAEANPPDSEGDDTAVSADGDLVDPDSASGDTGSITPGGQLDPGRQVRSTRRRTDAESLPRVPVEDRTVGTVYRSPDGREYRPSMFLTVTLPSYGPVGDGVPVDPHGYDYRRQALDAIHFPGLVDRLVQNLRRAAGYKMQYFAAVEPQRRLAPHLHAAIRGAIPHRIIRQVVAGTYHQVWWPAHDTAVYDDRLPVWAGERYVDPDTGECLPTWDEACAALTRPAHVVRLGSQFESRGIIAPSPEANRAVRYLTKYLTKSVAEPLTAAEAELESPQRLAHIARLHAELRYLPCSPGCANWLRYGVQPREVGPGMRPGWCPKKAHEYENLGLGGRRVLVSRQWSGKTLTQHRADRAEVVREALHAAGYLDPDIESMAAEVKAADGLQRYVWTDTDVPADAYSKIICDLIIQRRAWRAQYDQAKQAVESRSATGPDP